jgi:phosphate uptake regulator
MTKAEARKMMRLDAENEELRATIDLIQCGSAKLIREAVSYRVAIREIEEIIAEAKEFAK